MLATLTRETIQPQAERGALRAHWTGETNGGRSEVLHYEQHGNARSVEGVIAGAHVGEPFALTYRCLMDLAWSVRLFEVRPLGAAEPTRLHSDGAGRWTEGHGVPLDELQGCTDLEFGETAFTLTPIIRRLGLSAGQSADLDLVSLSAAEMIPVRVQRRLTCVQPLSIYRTEDVETGERVEVSVDRDGFVTAFPGRFLRFA